MSTHEPIPYPTPNTNTGKEQLVNLRDENGETQKTKALRSITGAIYEVGRYTKKTVYGKVYFGCILEKVDDSPKTYIRSPNLVVIKTVNKKKLAMNNFAEDPLTEISVAQLLAKDEGGVHENLLGQLETLSDAQWYYIVMERCGGGELFDYLASDKASDFTESTARMFFMQIVLGIQNLHNHDVYHGDIALDNILLTTDRRSCKIIDYAMCLRFARDQHGNAMPFPPQGVRSEKNYYRAPEVHDNTNPFSGPKADVWALGVVLFMMVVGSPPVNCPSRGSCVRYCCLANGLLWEMVKGWGIGHVSKHAQDLISRLLCVDPNERFTIEKILAHPWMKAAQ